MKPTILIPAALFLVPCILILSSFQQTTPPNDFRLLYKLTGGTWIMQTPKGEVYERWHKQNDNKLTSQSFRLNGADTAWIESVDLTRNGRTITYTSVVKDQNEGKAVPFKLTISSPEIFIFENPAHDFPQRIIYHFVTPDSLHAWADGKSNGKESRTDFYYKRKRD